MDSDHPTTLTPSWLNHLTVDATLISSILNLPVRGREAIIKLVQTVGGLYENQTVIFHGSVLGRVLVEYNAEIFDGTAIHGVVTLLKNSDGDIVSVEVHHSPLNAVNKLSEILRTILEADFGSEYFEFKR